MHNKREEATSPRAQSAHLRLNEPCHHSKFLHKGDIQGSGPPFGLRLVGRISG
jgi:hypothetical protein